MIRIFSCNFPFSMKFSSSFQNAKLKPPFRFRLKADPSFLQGLGPLIRLHDGLIQPLFVNG